MGAARIAQLNELAALSDRQQLAGVPQFRALELAGSWNVGQVTAERWLGEADRFATALPITLGMLETGALLCHQASVLLRRRPAGRPGAVRPGDGTAADVRVVLLRREGPGRDTVLP